MHDQRTVHRDSLHPSISKAAEVLALGAVGAGLWALSEYAIHRWVGHGKTLTLDPVWWKNLGPAGLRAKFNIEHVAHHVDTTYFAPTSEKLVAAAVTVPLLGAAMAPFLGKRRALALSVGFSCSYFAYEVIHRRIHTHAPKSRWALGLRKHHLAHHHASPRTNFSVTNARLDRWFGTHKEPLRVRIPSAIAPAWMKLEDGTLDARWAHVFELLAERR